MGSVDSLVGPTKRAVAGVQHAQPQTDRTVIRHGDTQADQGIPVRAHSFHQGIWFLKVVGFRVVRHPCAE